MTHPSSDKLPRSCKDCGSRRSGFQGNSITFECGSVFEISSLETGEGKWTLHTENSYIPERLVDNLGFKLNVDVRTATDREEMWRVIKEWSNNREIKFSIGLISFRAYTDLIKGTGEVCHEIRFYGRFHEDNPTKVADKICDLGAYLATYLGKDEFRYTDADRRTYRVHISRQAKETVASPS